MAEETPAVEPDASNEPNAIADTAEVDAETPEVDRPADETDTVDEVTPDAESEALSKVRREAKNLRERLKAAESRVDELARRLHTELTRASGKLADPSDLEFSFDNLDSPEALTAALDGLLEVKPHLRSRIPAAANVGQGAKNQGQPVGLLSHLKSLV